jgi:hypothetical protein
MQAGNYPAACSTVISRQINRHGSTVRFPCSQEMELVKLDSLIKPAGV